MVPGTRRASGLTAIRSTPGDRGEVQPDVADVEVLLRLSHPTAVISSSAADKPLRSRPDPLSVCGYRGGMNTDLTGKHAIVCGASAGIGRACATELAGLGASVTVVARGEDKLRGVIAQLPTPRAAHGQRHGTLVCDLGKPDDARRAIDGWLATHLVCHILVNNTGGPAPGPAAAMTIDALRAGFDSLLLTPHVLVQAVVPGMKQASYGRIINIASTSVKQPIANLAVSNVIRAATANWAKTLSQELAGFGITVNNVLPGYTDTERLAEIFEMRANKAGGGPDAVAKARTDTIATIPAGRLGRPEEIAAAVGFLASPAAAYVNGINLPVDGGRLATL